MRYIANDRGYLLEVSFGARIYCNERGCTEYTGGVPDGYDSLADWFTQEADKLHRWHIVEGELTLDEGAPEPEVYVEPAPVPTISMYKLWANPDLVSTFAAQTVALDLSGYDGVMVTVKFQYNGTDTRTTSGFVPIGTRSVCMVTNSDNANLRFRQFIVTETGVEFKTGVNGSNGAEGDGLAIPVAIYGIKGVVNAIEANN